MKNTTGKKSAKLSELKSMTIFQKIHNYFGSVLLSLEFKSTKKSRIFDKLWDKLLLKSVVKLSRFKMKLVSTVEDQSIAIISI